MAMHKITRTRNNVSLGRTLPSVERAEQRRSLLVKRQAKLLRLIRLAHKNKRVDRVSVLIDKLRISTSELSRINGRT